MAVTQAQVEKPQVGRPVTGRRLAITVLAGGPGGEREVSLESGKGVAKALESLGHEVHVEDIGPTNLVALARYADCIFVGLHGQFGEDGQLQAVLEERGLTYCGSGPRACALAMDKVRAKQRFVEVGLPTPRWAVAANGNIDDAVAAWSLPVVVKPVREGSSLNCRIVREPEALRPAVRDILAKYSECLVEEYIPGKEITAAILGEQVLPILEIRTPREFYDYEAKYVDDKTEYSFDIDLPEDLLRRIGEMSLAAHQVLGCRDFSRVDWRVDVERLAPYLLEVNVIPGLTSHSLLPKAAARAGISMSAMCQFIVDRALERGSSGA